jgi:3-hydroxyisobutyrate dehydrogenase-like beta-hydroxyacid dehydrogenase
MTTTLLGLGLMGSAMAARLSATGATVRGWNRSAHEPIPGVDLRSDLAAALDGAGTVLLCLFDGPACRAVLAAALDHLAPDAVVLNTTTTSPEEAVELERMALDRGRTYVHAPVLGSVPAVAAGTLLVLAGGRPDAVRAARPTLSCLAREVREVGGAADAARLKLVGNAALGGALVAVREVLRAAEAGGLGREQTLAVLQESQLGGLVAAKRGFLDADPPPTQFAARTLAKDLALWTSATGAETHAAAVVAALLADDRLPAGADIAHLWTDLG